MGLLWQARKGDGRPYGVAPDPCLPHRRRSTTLSPTSWCTPTTTAGPRTWTGPTASTMRAARSVRRRCRVGQGQPLGPHTAAAVSPCSPLRRACGRPRLRCPAPAAGRPQGTATSRWSCCGATWRCGGSSKSACDGGRSSQVGTASPALQQRGPSLLSRPALQGRLALPWGVQGGGTGCASRSHASRTASMTPAPTDSCTIFFNCGCYPNPRPALQ